MAQVVGYSTGAAALDTFFGAPAGTIEANIPDATSGDGLYQSVTGSAGDTVSFFWSLVETDYPPYDDTVFAIVSQDGNLLHYENLGCLVGGGGSCDHIVGDGGTQPWTSFSYTLPSAGTYQIGIGAINTMDSSVDPYLFVDDAAGSFSSNFSNTPEPATVLLIVPAFAALALRRKRLGR